MNNIAKDLESAGYELRRDPSTKERLFLKAAFRKEDEIFQYHVHIMALDSKEWHSFIRFRDYLRKSPSIAKEYADLKQEILKESGGNGVRYRELKAPFLEKILKM